MRSVVTLAGLAAVILVAAPVGAQSPAAGPSDARLCLDVRADAGIDLTDPTVVQVAIATGKIAITDVVPCAGGPAPSVGPTAAVGGTGTWLVSEDKDPMTDAPRAFAFLESTSGTSSFGSKISFGAACNAAGETVALVGWNDYLGSDSMTPVDTRVGDGAVKTSSWFHTEDDRSTIIFEADAEKLLKTMLGQTSLVVRATPYDSTATTAVFDITGIDDALTRIRELCGW